MNNDLIIKNRDNKLKLVLPSNIFKNSKSLSWVLEVNEQSLKLKLFDSKDNYKSDKILSATNQVVKVEDNTRFIIIPPNIITVFNLNSNSRLKFVSKYNFIELIPENSIKMYCEKINENSLALIYHEPVKIKRSNSISITIPKIVIELFDLKENEVLNYRIIKEYNQYILVISKINEFIDFPDDEICLNTISKVYKNQKNSVSSSLFLNKSINDYLKLNDKEFIYLSFYINYNLAYIILEG